MGNNIRVLYDAKYYVEPLVKIAVWSGDVALPHRSLLLTLNNTLNGEDQAVKFEVGKEIRFYADGAGLFRGIIFEYNIDNRGNATILAHDENVYLTKNTDTRKFVGMTAGAIAREVCKAFGIAVGSIAATGYIIPHLILRNMTLWDMIVTALTQTHKQIGRKYIVTSTDGKFVLREKKETRTRWMLEDGVNILGANRSQSIEDTRTATKVIVDDDKKPLTATATDSGAAKKYGLMQHLEQADSRMKQSAIDQLAKQRLKELAKVSEEITVEALGNMDVVAGTAVYAFESMTELVGGFYVNADSHTFKDGVHTMDVTISKTDDLPKLEYEDPERMETAKKAKKAAKAKTTRKKPKPKKPPKNSQFLDQIRKRIGGGAQ